MTTTTLAALAALLPAGWMTGPAAGLDPATGPGAIAGGGTETACPSPPDPLLIRLVPTARANGSSGQVRLHFRQSPFGVSTTRDGTHAFRLDLRVEGLTPPPETTVVAWAATPDLGTVVRLGTLAPDGTLEGRIALNKFLVFLTAEDDPDVERWSGPVLLRGSSPSGRMHSMAGHGPFESEPCAVIGF